jgi:hypothetical protein
MTTEVASWHEFFAVTAGIAATLSGLVFVAVSINLMQIISVGGFTTLALESLTQLLGAMTIGVVGLIPNQSASWLGLETMAVTVILWSLQTRWQIRFLRRSGKHPWRWTANRFFRTQIACLPFFFAGLLLWLARPAGLLLFVPGQLLSFVAGVANAWVLLVKIVRLREGDPAH